MPEIFYQFEQLDEHLSRPPLAAQRALMVAGVRLSAAGWDAMTQEIRIALAGAGIQPQIDTEWVRSTLSGVPWEHVKLFSPIPDPPASEVPSPLQHALGPGRGIPLALWQAVGALDRFVLLMLAENVRLMARAVDEIAVRNRLPLTQLPLDGFVPVVGHCEVVMDPRTVRRLHEPDVLEGRALVLARTAGVRAARRASEILGLGGETRTGITEVGSEIVEDFGRGILLWQGHVSTTEARFYPAASLLAVTTAATAVYTMVTTQLNESASITGGKLVEETWRVETGGAPTLGLGS